MCGAYGWISETAVSAANRADHVDDELPDGGRRAARRAQGLDRRPRGAAGGVPQDEHRHADEQQPCREQSPPRGRERSE